MGGVVDSSGPHSDAVVIFADNGRYYENIVGLGWPTLPLLGRRKELTTGIGRFNNGVNTSSTDT